LQGSRQKEAGNEPRNPCPNESNSRLNRLFGPNIAFYTPEKMRRKMRGRKDRKDECEVEQMSEIRIQSEKGS
jgi:hypothetical protein